MISPPLEELARLAGKYDRMARLRRDHARGMPVADRGELRSLSRDFPGALSELDTMESSEIDERATQLRAASEGAEIEPWMTWVFAFHVGLRAAFEIRAKSPTSSRSLIPIDDPFVAAVLAPPRGRLVPVVLAAIARWTGDAHDDIARAILPRRRCPPIPPGTAGQD